LTEINGVSRDHEIGAGARHGYPLDSDQSLGSRAGLRCAGGGGAWGRNNG
jgi:hypothetical protein